MAYECVCPGGPMFGGAAAGTATRYIRGWGGRPKTQQDGGYGVGVGGAVIVGPVTGGLAESRADCPVQHHDSGFAEGGEPCRPKGGYGGERSGNSQPAGYGRGS